MILSLDGMEPDCALKLTLPAGHCVIEVSAMSWWAGSTVTVQNNHGQDICEVFRENGQRRLLLPGRMSVFCYATNVEALTLTIS